MMKKQKSGIGVRRKSWQLSPFVWQQSSGKHEKARAIFLQKSCPYFISFS